MSEAHLRAAHSPTRAPWLFKPGVSGNPAGRPKAKDKDIVEQVRKIAPEIVKRLIDLALARVECKPETSVRAAEVLLNRAYGLPRQAVDVNQQTTQFVAVLPMPAASAEEWQRKAAELNGRTIEHQEFEPAPVVELPSADMLSPDSHCKD